MTREQLTAIKQRIEKATPGPWVGDRTDGTIKYQMGQSGCECAAESPWDCPHLVLRVNHKSGDYGFLGQRRDEDAEFVMGARTDMPALVEALERAQEALKEIARDNCIYWKACRDNPAQMPCPACRARAVLGEALYG